MSRNDACLLCNISVKERDLFLRVLNKVVKLWFDVHAKLAPKMWAPNNLRVRMLRHRRSTIFASGKVTNMFPHHWLSPPEEVNQLCTWNTAVGCEQTLCFYLFIQVNVAQGSRTAKIFEVIIPLTERWKQYV